MSSAEWIQPTEETQLSAVDRASKTSSGLLDLSSHSDMLENPNWFTAEVHDWVNTLLFDLVCVKIPLQSRISIYINVHIIGFLSGFDLIHANYLARNVRLHDPYSSADCKNELDVPSHLVGVVALFSSSFLHSDSGLSCVMSFSNGILADPTQEKVCQGLGRLSLQSLCYHHGEARGSFLKVRFNVESGT